MSWRERRPLIVAAVVFLPGFLDPAGLLAAAAGALALGASLWPWPTRRVGLGAAGLAVAAISVLVDALYVGRAGLTLIWMPFEALGLLIFVGRIVRRAPAGRPLLLAAAPAVALLALPFRFAVHSSPQKWSGAVFAACLALFPLACAIAIGLYLRSLDAERERAVRESRREQRVRVARDLHDFVAHELTGIVLEADAAQMSGAGERETKDLLARVREASVRALEATERTVREFDDDRAAAGAARPPDLGDLPDLVARFEALGSVRAELDLPADLPGRTAAAPSALAFAVVLEALTNVRRHAGAAGTVRIAVAAAGERVEVVVEDDGALGASRPPSRPGTGSGLAALERRIAALGGTLAAGPTGGGWLVEASLPLSAAPG
jgi:signal transduction histidine kinase